MTMSLWVVVASALIAVLGTIYTARSSLKTSQASLKQSLEIQMRELAQKNATEAEDARQDERGSNLAEAKQLREELKAGREEMRQDRDRIAEELKIERKRVADVEEFARIEQNEFRQEISMLQAQQREIDTERVQHKQFVEGLKKTHCTEVAKYKKQLAALAATVAKMEARIKELEAGKASG